MLTDEVVSEMRQKLRAADDESKITSGRSVEARRDAVLAVEQVFLDTVDGQDLSSPDRERLSDAYRSLTEAGADGYRRARRISDAVSEVGAITFLVTLCGVAWAFWNDGNIGRLLLVGFSLVSWSWRRRCTCGV